MPASSSKGIIESFMMDFLHVKLRLIVLLAAIGIAATAHAQTFPNRTIRIIVPYAPAAASI